METNKILPATLLGLVALGYVSYALLNRNQNNSLNEPNIVQPGQPQINNNTSEPITIDPEAIFKDGDYTETVKYTAHGHSESITVTATLANNIIKEIDTTFNWADPSSEKYTDRLDAKIDSTIVGKKISEAMVTRVSGATEAGVAFNTAMKLITEKAIQ